MKPIFVSFQCFGPFPNEVKIDLLDKGREGLFLIGGDTGAGKTTILDAMCYALYYTSSSGNNSDPGKGDFASMRSRFAKAGEHTVTFVELQVEKNGRIYRFRRELRPKKRTQGFDEIHLCDELIGEVWQPLEANATKTSVNAQAVKLTGLTADQFRQIIILPQGRFEQLLTSDSSEKETILSRIFDAERWQNAVEGLKRTLNDEATEIAKERSVISGQLKNRQCATLEELNTKIEALKEELPELTQQREKSEELLQKATKSNQAATADYQLFADLDKREKTLADLEKKASVYADKADQLQGAEKAEVLRSDWNQLNNGRDTVLKSAEAARNAQLTAQDKQKANEQALTAWKAHDGKREQYEKGILYLERLNNATGAYDSYAKQTGIINEQTADLQKAYTAEKKAEQAEKAALAAFEKAEKRSNEADESYRELQRRYSLCAAGRLAKDLEEEKPCPVCGSIHHPAPATLTEEHVTDAQLDEADKADRAARDAYKKMGEKLQESQKAHTEASGRAKECAAKLEGAKQLAETLHSQLMEEIPDKEKLEATKKSYQASIQRYKVDDEKLAKARTDASEAYNLAQGRAESTAKQAAEDAEHLQTMEAAWQQSLAKAEIADEDHFRRSLMNPAALDALRKEIEAYHSACDAAKHELEDQRKKTENKQRPDITAIQQALKLAQDSRDAAIKAENEASQRLQEWTSLSQSISKTTAVLADREQKWGRKNNFLGKLDNSKGMNLHRYVLAAMLDTVIVQANQLLLNVHDGRYQLQRSDTASGRRIKAGLELNVLDYSTNSVRGVKSLSGGEKFLVSLALAIGLNTVMQAQAHGIRIEAIFVDEGFGSLDGDSINDAMQMLQRVRRSHGMVGIISHIEALRNEIPVHIDVRKDVNRGSFIPEQ